MFQPSIRTTVVGSYPVPDWLTAMPSRQGLIDATRVVFKIQEMAGIDVVVDGELYRWDINHPDTNGMIDYFIRPMEGIRSQVTRTEINEFSLQEGMGFRVAPAGVVEGPIGEGVLNIPSDYIRARECTNHPMKFTVTGPHMLCKTLMDHHYKSRPELAQALGRTIAKQVADINPDVIQIDEANITGHPQEIEWAVEAINLVLDAAIQAKEKGVHLCFGNYGGQSIQKGHWEQLMNLMNQLHCDHVLLEFAFRGYDELAFFRSGVDPRIGLGIGVVDVKSNTVESPDEIASRIELATRKVGPDRIKWVHPDCGFWMNKRSIADRKIANLVAGRNLLLGIGNVN
jgi:5-methyltetrahydropteroyltriglutamate--homocysteine methyltransferase